MVVKALQSVPQALAKLDISPLMALVTIAQHVLQELPNSQGTSNNASHVEMVNIVLQSDRLHALLAVILMPLDVAVQVLALAKLATSPITVMV